MKLVSKIENIMEGFFTELPPLPDPFRKNLAKIWPWLALVLGILQIVAAYWLWQLTQVTRTILSYDLYQPHYFTAGLSALDLSFIYIGLAALILEGILLILAFAPLRAGMRRGWELLFLVTLINVAYALISLFIIDRGLASTISSLVISAVGFYLLFQIRNLFTKGSGK